jgi:light-harvesting protein B-800-850 alpha chain
MNQGRIWCVVSPNVGLPLMLGSVAITALIVHACVLSHTTWFSGYWQGAAKPKVAEAAPAADGKAAFSMTVTTVPATSPTSPASFVITVSPNTVATTAATVASAPQSAPVPIKTARSD